jgi:lipopolysaccharide export system permease protein
MNFVKLWNFIELQKDSTIHTDDYLEARLELHKKFARPLACLLIALVGAPLGILPRRSSSSWNYVVLAMIIFQFYVTISVCNSMAEAGKMLPMLAAWFPNIILFSIAFFIIGRRVRTA